MGRVTFQECADLCGGSKSCRAFDVSEKKGKNIKKFKFVFYSYYYFCGEIGALLKCWLFAHQDVRPASAVEGKCFSVKGVKDRHKKKAARAAKAFGLPKDKAKQLKQQALRPKDSHTVLGPGMCRGPKWASKHWPKDLGQRDTQGCFKVKSHFLFFCFCCSCCCCMYLEKVAEIYVVVAAAAAVVVVVVAAAAAV